MNKEIEEAPKKRKKSKASKNKRCNLTIDWVEQETGESYEKPKGGKSY